MIQNKIYQTSETKKLTTLTTLPLKYGEFLKSPVLLCLPYLVHTQKCSSSSISTVPVPQPEKSFTRFNPYVQRFLERGTIPRNKSQEQQSRKKTTQLPTEKPLFCLSSTSQPCEVGRKVLNSSQFTEGNTFMHAVIFQSTSWERTNSHNSILVHGYCEGQKISPCFNKLTFCIPMQFIPSAETNGIAFLGLYCCRLRAV